MIKFQQLSHSLFADLSRSSRGIVGLALLMLFLSTQSGCQIFRKYGSSSTTPIPVQFKQLPSQQQLIASLNSRSARIRQLSSSATVALPGAPKIRGTLQVQFPDHMRLKAGIMGASEMVDVGSNAQDFWILSKANLPGRQFADMAVVGFGTNVEGKSTLRFPVYPDSLWDDQNEDSGLANVTDGTSNTIFAIHAPDEAAVSWADPTPWTISKDDPMRDVFGDRDEAIVAMMDGSTKRLQKANMTNEKLKAMLTISGGEVIQD